jgi:hypothetical protein
MAVVAFPGFGHDHNSRDDEPSLESTGSSGLLRTGMTVKLLSPGFGEVGVGKVVEVQPVGQWLGVDIPFGSTEFVLLRPTDVMAAAVDFPLIPCQRGYNSVVETLLRTVLWRTTDVMIPAGDLRSDDSPFTPRERWVGLEVQRFDELGTLLSSGRIMAALPTDHFRSGWLGDDHVGVTVLDVFVGDSETIMSHDLWPIIECCFPSGRSLKCTIDHFASRPVQQDSEAHLGGRAKEPYRFIFRLQDLNKKDSLFARKTTDDEIRKVSSERCCLRNCCQHFVQCRTLAVRQKFYEKSFEDRKEYGISVGGHMHSIEGDRKRKYVTLLGTEVCAVAWYTIHGISKSSFYTYMDDFNKGVINGTHGNQGIKRPRLATVQAMGSMTSIINDNADQMPHQMRGVGNGRVDTLKFLPAGNNWKHIRASVNEVLIGPIANRIDHSFSIFSHSKASSPNRSSPAEPLLVNMLNAENNFEVNVIQPKIFGCSHSGISDDR